MAPVTSSVGAVLARLPLFSQVSADLLAVLSAAAVPVTLGRGEVLFHRGEECTGFFVVLRGQVKLAVTSAEGNEKVLEIIGAGETFAEGVMFADRPYPVTATALVAVDLLSVPRRTVLDLIDAEPTFARRMLAGMSVRLHTMVADVSAMALHSGTQRVIGFLLAEAAPDDATLRAGGSAVVRLPAGKAVLASRLSLTPETFSRVLRSLAEQGLAQVDGRHVTLPDLARLAAWSGA
ncbi:MAG: Crp/Fnr family transcriptional regulator [Actinobacteria bacterium]|nr:Crp/Fnr family transcriptional regulator [Actinomycetota bacterium]